MESNAISRNDSEMLCNNKYVLYTSNHSYNVFITYMMLSVASISVKMAFNDNPASFSCTSMSFLTWHLCLRQHQPIFLVLMQRFLICIISY